MPTPLEILLTDLDPGTRDALGHRVLMNPPDAPFDPATDGSLEKWLLDHRLPPQPDPISAPVAFRNWRTAILRPELPPLPTFIQRGAVRGGPRSLARGRGSSSVPHESSRNWSGGYVRPRDFNKVALVQGRWKVPGPASSHSSDSIFASSTWVGLDGRDPASRSLPQVGTGQYFVRLHFPLPPDLADRLPSLAGGAGLPVVGPALFAWWQWWDRDDANSRQVIIEGLDVNQGDLVYSQVQVIPPGTVFDEPKSDEQPAVLIQETMVSVLIWNQTTDVAFAAYLKPPPPDPARPVLRVEGRTADWILERPAWPNQVRPRSFDFANYDTATFTDRAAASDLGRDIPLDRSRLIRMNAWDDRVKPGRLVSESELVPGPAENLKLTYRP